MDLLEQYDIDQPTADRLWATVAEHAQGADGRCVHEECRAWTCWTRASAVGRLKLAGRYAAGPATP